MTNRTLVTCRCSQTAQLRLLTSSTVMDRGSAVPAAAARRAHTLRMFAVSLPDTGATCLGCTGRPDGFEKSAACSCRIREPAAGLA